MTISKSSNNCNKGPLSKRKKPTRLEQQMLDHGLKPPPRPISYAQKLERILAGDDVELTSSQYLRYVIGDHDGGFKRSNNLLTEYFHALEAKMGYKEGYLSGCIFSISAHGGALPKPLQAKLCTMTSTLDGKPVSGNYWEKRFYHASEANTVTFDMNRYTAPAIQQTTWQGAIKPKNTSHER
ncbi:MAG: hypothetical protein ACOYNL_08470 [Rickettsiales bacterium]